jgi:hypothetical protein
MNFATSAAAAVVMVTMTSGAFIVLIAFLRDRR